MFVYKLSLLHLLVPLRQNVVRVHRQSPVVFLYHIRLQKIHLLRIGKNLRIAALLLRNSPQLAQKLIHLLPRRQAARTHLIIREYTKLHNILLKPQISQILQVIFPLHIFIDHLHNGKTLLLFDKISAVLTMHFPHLRHVDFLLDFRLRTVVVLSPEGRELEKQEPPHLTVLFDHALHIGHKDILQLFGQVRQLYDRHAVDSPFSLQSIKLEDTLILHIGNVLATILYESPLVDDTPEKVVFLLPFVLLFIDLLINDFGSAELCF